MKKVFCKKKNKLVKAYLLAKDSKDENLAVIYIPKSKKRNRSIEICRKTKNYYVNVDSNSYINLSKRSVLYLILQEY